MKTKNIAGVEHPASHFSTVGDANDPNTWSGLKDPKDCTMADWETNWFEIFKAGDYGKKGNWTPAKLDAVVKNFNDGVWIPPAVFGHPEEDSPAMGWAKELKHEDGVLFAKLRDVQPELKAAVPSGRFPNRSAAFYKGTPESGPVLRHIGFLGGMPPHIKDLKPIPFSDGEFVAIEFDEEDTMDPKELKKSIRENLREFFSELFSGEERQRPAAATFTEEDRRALMAEAQKPLLDEITKLRAEFADDRTKATARATELTQSERKANVAAFVAKMKAANKWIPAFSEAGMEAVLLNLALADEKVKFGEAGKEKEVSAFEATCSFIESLGAIVPKGEVAGAKKVWKGKNVLVFNETRNHKVDDASVLLRERALEIQDEKKCKFGEALTLARAEMGTEAVAAGGTSAGAV